MTIDEILAMIDGKAGQFLSVTWTTTVTPAAAYKGTTITKTTTATVRTGVTYDNTADTIAGREDGTLPSENAGLPWGSWVRFPYHISHKGTDYVRLYLLADHVPTSAYTIDGTPASKSDVLALVTPSKAREMTTPPARDLLTLTVKAENIDRIG